MVRIKLPARPHKHEHEACFHPTMVRIKLVERGGDVTVPSRFHPTMVRIKPKSLDIEIENEEFPSHNGSNQTYWNEKEWASFLSFPSHNGSNQTQPPWLAGGMEFWFPSHNGSNQTGGLQWKGDIQFCFHPTMVRIKPACGEEIRYKKQVSIPQWFESNSMVHGALQDIPQFPSHNGSNQTATGFKLSSS